MTRLVHSLLVCAALVALLSPVDAQRRRPAADPVPAPAPELPSDLRVRSMLSQSAAWVGDAIDFVIEIDTAPGVEVVGEDLMPDKLVLDGLELGAAGSSSATRADGWRTLRHTYRVVAWDTTPPKTVGDLTVRFRRPVTTATANGTAPAADVKVPGATLAIRSTLPDDGGATGVRDRLAALPGPGWLRWIRPVGWGFIALGAAPVLLWAGTRLQRPRVAKTRPSSRSLHARLQALFADLQGIDTTTVQGRRRAYDVMDTDVRSYLAQAEAIPAAALTPEELRPRLSASTRLNGDEVCDILGECERARYAPDERLPDTGTVLGTIARLRTALGR